MRAVGNHRGARTISLALVAGLVAFEAVLALGAGAVGIPGLVVVRFADGSGRTPQAQVARATEDGGETVLRAGDAAGFKAGSGNGHCLVNRSGSDAVYLEIGTRAVRERAEYPDIDMRAERDEKGTRYLHKSGEPYPGSER